MKPAPGQLGSAVFVGLVAATVTIVAVKLVTGLALAPLAIIAVLKFAVAFALKVRIERMR